ncbi:hypothetical protein BDZ89DRAFT_1150128 [Hymenopellis radicata]|nr:hypothetical protein BDZ89DRAFT_1150128 [Hymenopellis radicata]
MAILDLTLSSFLYPRCVSLLCPPPSSTRSRRVSKRDEVPDVTSPFLSVFDALACLFRDVDDIAALGLVSSVIVACYYYSMSSRPSGTRFETFTLCASPQRNLKLPLDYGMLSSTLRGDVRDVVFATRPFPIWFRAGGKAKMTTLLRILEEDRLLPCSSTAHSALPERASSPRPPPYREGNVFGQTPERWVDGDG